MTRHFPITTTTRCNVFVPTVYTVCRGATSFLSFKAERSSSVICTDGRKTKDNSTIKMVVKHVAELTIKLDRTRAPPTRTLRIIRYYYRNRESFPGRMVMGDNATVNRAKNNTCVEKRISLGPSKQVMETF